MRLWRAGILGGIVGLSMVGCDSPGPIIPVAPPGANIPRATSDDDPAQALGEMPAPIMKTDAAPAASKDFVPALPTSPGETKTTKGGVRYETLKQGTGAELKSGQTATLHYVGTIEKGEVFDSTRTTDQPAKFRVGVQKLIKGWDEAIPGMKVGEVRKLTIPPAMAYGARGEPPRIPANATLVFEVELLDVAP